MRLGGVNILPGQPNQTLIFLWKLMIEVLANSPSISLPMKLTLLTASLAAVLTLTCVSAQAQTNAATSASTTTTSTTTTDAAAMKKVPYKGTISAVDTTANSVTIKGAKGDMTLMVDSSTKFKGGAALSDFKVGDAVTGSYMKDASGKMTAHSLHKKMAK